MTNYFISTFFILLAFTVCSAEKQKIVFARPATVGNMMSCRLSTVSGISSVTSFTNVNMPDRVNAVSRNLTATGMLKVLDVKKNGYASKVEFTVDTMEGVINKRPFKPDWKEMMIIADLTVKPVCDFRIKGSEKKFSREEINMLSLLFKPAPDDYIGDYIGTDKPVGIGDTWEANKSPFVNLFKKQQLLFPEKHIQGKVTLKSRKKFESIDCWEIEEKLKVVGLPGFAFHFSLSILLPVDSKYGNIKMTRKAFEKMEKTPQVKHFMTSGIKKIILEMKDTMTAVMIPIK